MQRDSHSLGLFLLVETLFVLNNKTVQRSTITAASESGFTNLRVQTSLDPRALPQQNELKYLYIRIFWFINKQEVLRMWALPLDNTY